MTENGLGFFPHKLPSMWRNRRISNWSNIADYQSVTDIELEWLQVFNWKMPVEINFTEKDISAQFYDLLSFPCPSKSLLFCLFIWIFSMAPSLPSSLWKRLLANVLHPLSDLLSEKAVLHLLSDAIYLTQQCKEDEVKRFGMRRVEEYCRSKYFWDRQICWGLAIGLLSFKWCCLGRAMTEKNWPTRKVWVFSNAGWTEEQKISDKYILKCRYFKLCFSPS